MKNNNNLRQNLLKFYIFKIFSSMFFFVPIMVLFWQENGLSLTQVMLLQSIFAIFTVILEIPSGYFADIFGRKKTLLIACITGLLAMLVYSLGSNFLHFVIAEIFFALNVSFTSGTTSAFVYDTLEDLGEENSYKKIWGNSMFYGLIALAFSNVVGGFIATINFRYAFFATLPFITVLIPLVLSMTEPTRHKIIAKSGYTKVLIDSIKITILQNKKLRWIIIYSGVIYAFNQSALWLYQPYFKLSGLKIGYFGIVFASFQIVAAFSSKYAYKLEKKIGPKYSLFLLTFLVSVSYLLMSNFIYLFSFSFCFIQQFVRGFKKIIVSDYINKLAPSNMRATTLSAESFVGRLIYAVIVPFFGYVADIYTLRQSLALIGSTALLSGLFIIFLLKRDRVI